MTGRREELRERGWADDVHERRTRRPKQEIGPSEHNGGGGLVITPSWYYACTECGEKTRIATEDTSTWTDCETCGTVQRFEPLGELTYPEENP